MPDLEYTLYQPQQLKSRVPALMIHGFATRRARRKRLFDKFSHHFIEHGKVGQISQISIEFDDIV